MAAKNRLTSKTVALPLWESIGRPQRPFLEKNAEAKLRLRRIADAIRVRG